MAAEQKFKKDVNVEGTNWNVERVNELHQSKEDFVKTHIDDEGTYSNMKDKTKKQKTLELAWQAIKDNTPNANPVTKSPELTLK